MNPKPLSLALLPAGVTAAVGRQLDQQLLQAVEDEALSAAQQAELLSWAHDHLLSAYVATRLNAVPDPARTPARRRPIKPCTNALVLIGHLLLGMVPLEEDLTFQCPPVCCPRAHALRERLPAWVQRRVQLAAQRTRLHTDAELDLLWQAIEAHLIVAGIVWSGLAKWLEVDVPATRKLEAITRGCLEAAHGARGLAWTPAGAVLGRSAGPRRKISF